jgi:hypothetical protein
VSLGHTCGAAHPSGKRPIRRLLCTTGQGDSHSFSLTRVWYQLPSAYPVPEECWPAIKTFSRAGPQYEVPAGDVLSTRPAPAQLIERAEAARRNLSGRHEPSDDAVLLDGSPAPISPRGVPFRTEGREYAKLVLRDKRLRLEEVSEEDAEDELDADLEREDIWVNSHPVIRSSTPKTPSSPTRIPVGNRFTNLEVIGKVESPITHQNLLGKLVKKQGLESSIHATLTTGSPKVAAVPRSRSPDRPSSLHMNKEEVRPPKRFHTSEFAMANHVPYATIAMQRPAKSNPDVVLPTKRKVAAIQYTVEERQAIYAGKDPRKRKLVELYVSGLRRTRKSDIRNALDIDGVPKADIIDIQFIGKGITSLLIPATREVFYRTQLGKIAGFKVAGCI